MNDSRWGIVIPLTCIIITILLTIIFAPFIFWDVVHHDEDETQYLPSYNDCAPSVCGNSTIRNPFGRCGQVFVDCVDNHTVNFYDIDGGDGPRVMGDFLGTVMGDITESSYSTQTVQIAQHIGHSPQPIFLTEITENGYLFSLSNAYTEGSLYKCTQRPTEINENMTWLDWGETHTHYLFYRGSGNINESSINSSCIWYCYLAIPADEKYNISADKNFELLNKKGFQVTWASYFDGSCEASGGRHDFYSSYCICPNDDVHYRNCSDGQDPIGKITSIGVMAGIFFAGCGLFIIVVVSCIVVRRQNCCCKNTGNEEEQSIRAFMDTLDSRTPSVENFLNYYTSQAPTRYSYTHIMIYTNNLVDKVGKGGFGTVYKGKLPSGRLIAVKILDESKQSEQQFIAEVATVGTTCHVNLVRLLGYCSQGSRRALVYEYMVNGSLEKYIHGDNEDELDWKQLYSIALGTARGLAYLHDECRNRILHFDIKPHNVLLDSNFLPKVADFGLAKISDREESHISVANRGTLGYAAPEMWSGIYGPVTDKSDVYSYGMLLMEMVGEEKTLTFIIKRVDQANFSIQSGLSSKW